LKKLTYEGLAYEGLTYEGLTYERFAQSYNLSTHR